MLIQGFKETGLPLVKRIICRLKFGIPYGIGKDGTISFRKAATKNIPDCVTVFDPSTNEIARQIRTVNYPPQGKDKMITKIKRVFKGDLDIRIYKTDLRPNRNNVYRPVKTELLDYDYGFQKGYPLSPRIDTTEYNYTRQTFEFKRQSNYPENNKQGGYNYITGQQIDYLN